MASTPQARAAYLLGLSNERVATPVTMSGGSHLYSYALLICKHEADGYKVLNIRSSQTTNRHIRACHAALQAAGYVAAGTEETTQKERRPYSFYEDVTRGWTVYRLPEGAADALAEPIAA